MMGKKKIGLNFSSVLFYNQEMTMHFPASSRSLRREYVFETFEKK